MRQLVKDAIDAIADIVSGAASGANMISVPVAAPDIQKIKHDPANPLCYSST
jgi:hypothetical protein